MTSEPAEEAISNFVSFTSVSRDRAIAFLKVSNNASARFSLPS